MKLNKNILVAIALLLTSMVVIAQVKNSEDYKNKSLPVEKRVNDLLNRMTLEEKILIIGGDGFATKPIERLGIPALKMADGPLGVRWGESNAYPSGIAMASTWDPELIGRVGEQIAIDTKVKGRDVILGPCVNIARVPMGGRNFESFGEDPYLASRFAVSYIKGVQRKGVVATVKHFAVNNHEHERFYVDAQVDERTFNEIYFPTFRASVKEADVLAFMASYNKVNGFYASENGDLLLKKLKAEWGFGGLVMSDWGAVHSSVPTALNGLDLEMPNGKYLNIDSLMPAINSGIITQEILNEKVRRILTVMFKVGLFDNPQPTKEKIDRPEVKEVAYKTAAESIVLLKNDKSTLPLNAKKIKSIAVVGPNAVFTKTGGGGSSKVYPRYEAGPLDAIKKIVGKKVNVTYAPGVVLQGDLKPIEDANWFLDAQGTKSGVMATYFVGKDFDKEFKKVIEPTLYSDWSNNDPLPGMPNDGYSVEWNGYLKAPHSGTFVFELASDDGSKLYLNDQLVIDNWGDHALMTKTYEMNLTAGQLYKVKVQYYENGGDAACKMGWRLPDANFLAEAVELAKQADVVLFFGGTSEAYESEGFDRESLTLPGGQDKMLQELFNVNKNVIVVLQSGSPVDMRGFVEKSPAILQSFFGGMEGGNAIADVLFGKVNPSGKLPVTIPLAWEDCSAYGLYRVKDSVSVYSDGLFVGYRHFDKKNIPVQYPFGYGLSYTSFELSNLKVDQKEVFVTVKNTGKTEGAEVVQLYVSDLSSTIEVPVKELKRFEKIFLKPGESKTIKMTLNDMVFAHYDIKSHAWKKFPGNYKLSVGNSSASTPLQTTIEVK